MIFDQIFSRFPLRILSGLFAACWTTSSDGSELAPDGSRKEVEWPSEVQKINIPSSFDDTKQDALARFSTGETPAPLIVFLHQWSSSYKEPSGRTFAKYCIAHNWSYIQPDFRGPNWTPLAMGSEAVVSDLKDALEYMFTHANVDRSRVYLVGASGGGYASLLAAGRLTSYFTAVSSWVPISDLVAWHAQSIRNNYSKNIEASLGAPPLPGTPEEKDAIKRSALPYLNPEITIPIQIGAGIHDGHTGSVPISHSFHAFNALVHPKDHIPAEDIRLMTEKRQIPATYSPISPLPEFAKKPVLYFHSANKKEIIIFQGGHEIVSAAALKFFENHTTLPQ